MGALDSYAPSSSSSWSPARTFTVSPGRYSPAKLCSASGFSKRLRPGTVCQVVPEVAQHIFGGSVDLQDQPALVQPPLKAAQLDLDDRTQLFTRELVEHDDLIQAVQELGAECCRSSASTASSISASPLAPVICALPTLLVMSARCW